MCDCYDHQCEVCEDTVPMHIGDCNYPRTDFRVWCAAHLDQAVSGSIVFTLLDDYGDEYPVGWQCAIHGPDVGEDGDMLPNLGARMTEERKR